MGLSLKRLVRKAVKLGGKIAKPILAATPAGQAVLRGQQVLKSLGGNLKAARLGKIEPLSVRGAIEKVAVSPARSLRRFPTSEGMTAIRSIRRGSKKRKAARMPQKRKTATGTTRRLPPAGGLDLRAMAAQWRAAGKPGTWRDWIRSNQIRKPA